VRHLLADRNVAPHEIIVLTFTNQAATECHTRIGEALGAQAVRGLIACTVHSLCLRLLRANANAVARRANFTIYDEHDVQALIDYVLADERRASVHAAARQSGRCSVARAQQKISLAKNHLQDPEQYEQRSRDPAAPFVASVWRELEQELRASGGVDFDDLLVLTRALLVEHPEVLPGFRRRWLFVDEMQDLTRAQLSIVRLLSGAAGNLTVVGDPDQALYQFNGADPRNLLSFAASFCDRRERVMSRNFRSGQEIVDAAGKLIAHNRNRAPIEFVAARGPGARVCVRAFANEYAEATANTQTIARALHRGTSPNAIMLLVRDRFALQPPLRALARANIPHRVLGSRGLYERKVIKDALAYLTLLANPDDIIALARAISSPRGVGDATAAAIAAHARESGHDLLSACAEQDLLGRVTADARAKITAFGQALLAVRASSEAGLSVADTVSATLTIEGGLLEYYRQRLELRGKPGREAEQAKDDLPLMCESATVYQQQHDSKVTLLGFLDQALGLHQEPEDAEQAVKLATFHRGKGGEASIVYLCAAEEGVSPSRPALASGADDAIEGERRAFYVAMTRARDVLNISWCRERSERPTKGRSRFIAEAGL
jgi:DNA helicase-2/ATP-dependent DNA helicase PcrA